MHVEPRLLQKKTEVVGILERICQTLELSDAQRELTRSRYETVGQWLAEAEDSLLRTATIYPHGSLALGTTTKPISYNEFDVDLICFVPGLHPAMLPSILKKAIGDRLRQNGHYAPILEEKPRCWRLSYANQFHLDITPSIRNPLCSFGGELVPDKVLREWKPTNPKGYRALFERRASRQPRIRVQVEAFAERLRAEIEPFPAETRLKGILRRAVQLQKRHRDVYFEKRHDSSLAPISILITTLAARSYEYCVTAKEYDSEFDLLCDIVRLMPSFIERRTDQGRTEWFVWNETTAGENFAEKWNEHPAQAEAFFSWHARMLGDVESLQNISGIDRFTESLSRSFGELPVSRAMSSLTKEISIGRVEGRLAVSPGIGLTAQAGRGYRVRPNTFFGVD